MKKGVLIILIIIAIGLITSMIIFMQKQENSPEETDFPEQKNESMVENLNICGGFKMKVDGGEIPFTPKTERGKITEIKNGNFNIGASREEGGLFQLIGFNSSKLKEGTYSGEGFALGLLFSIYMEGACTDEKFKEHSKLIIEKYDKEENIISGCYSGKLDCNGTIIEFQASFNEQIPTPEYLATF